MKGVSRTRWSTNSLLPMVLDKQSGLIMIFNFRATLCLNFLVIKRCCVSSNVIRMAITWTIGLGPSAWNLSHLRNCGSLRSHQIIIIRSKGLILLKSGGLGLGPSNLGVAPRVQIRNRAQKHTNRSCKKPKISATKRPTKSQRVTKKCAKFVLMIMMMNKILCFHPVIAEVNPACYI